MREAIDTSEFRVHSERQVNWGPPPPEALEHDHGQHDGLLPKPASEAQHGLGPYALKIDREWEEGCPKCPQCGGPLMREGWTICYRCHRARRKEGK